MPPPHLLVDLGTVVEALLTGAGGGPLHAGRVPRADAGHLAEATMGLARQAGDAPALHHALRAEAARDGDGVDHLVGLEDGVDGHLLLEEAVGEVDLLGDGASVDLRRRGRRVGCMKQDALMHSQRCTANDGFYNSSMHEHMLSNATEGMR